VATRSRKQIIVNVRENAESIAGLAQSLEGVVGVREWFPERQALREEGGARSADRPSTALNAAAGSRLTPSASAALLKASVIPVSQSIRVP
jgi:hypothetical protein